MQELPKMDLVTSHLQEEQRCVLVYGDILLDKYVHYDSKKLAEDVALPVYVPVKYQYELGGAGNIVKNLVDWNVKVFPHGVYGTSKITQLYEDLGIDKSYLIQIPGFRQTKKRYLVGNYQHMRSSTCDAVPWSTDLSSAVIQNVEALLETNSISSAIIADYYHNFCASGVLGKVFQLLKENDITVFVDPYGRNFQKYQNCNVFKLCDKEVEARYGCQMLCMKDYLFWSEKILEEVGCDSVFVTLGAKGIFYNTRRKHGLVECKNKFVGDACGCGDIVLSVIACLYKKNMEETEIKMMLQIANEFAAINLHKDGACQVTIGEWLHTLDKPLRIKQDQAITLTRYFQHHPTKVGLTNGCFDLLHAGHIETLKFGKSRCDVLFVFLNSDESVTTLKGKNRPIINLSNRLAVLSSVKYIDYIVVFEECDFDCWLDRLHFDQYIKGADCNVEFLKQVDAAKVLLCPLVPNISTTDIEHAINLKCSTYESFK